jgi:hypothetical protein
MDDDKGHGKGEVGKAHYHALRMGNISHKDYAVLEGEFSSDSAGLSYSSD